MRFDLEYAIEVLPALLSALRITVLATALGMTAALAVGLAWALLRRSRRRLVRAAASLSLELVRSTPLLVQLYLIFFTLPRLGVTLSPLAAGVLGLGLHHGSYVAEIYRAGIDAVPRGQWEAAVSLGLSRARTSCAIILPQAVPRVLPALGNCLVAMFKDTPLLGAITVLEMLQVARLEGARTFRYLEPVTLVGLLFLAVSLVAAWGLRRLERWSLRHVG
jgi:polar amino acid transport system permease protein